MLRQEAIESNGTKSLSYGKIQSEYIKLFAEKLKVDASTVKVEFSTTENATVMSIYGPTGGEGNITMYSFPVCCGLCVIGNICGVSNRQRGLASLLSEMAQDYAYSNGYTIVLASDKVANYTENIFNKQLWSKAVEFKNRRTKNQVHLHFKNLETINKPITLTAE